MWLDGKWEMNFLGREPRAEWVLKTQQFAEPYKVQPQFTLCELQVQTFSAAVFISSEFWPLLLNTMHNCFTYALMSI